MEKRSVAPGSPDGDIPSLAAVTAVGTALGDILFSSEADTASPAVTGLDINFCFIDKFHTCSYRALISVSGESLPYFRRVEHPGLYSRAPETKKALVIQYPASN